MTIEGSSYQAMSNVASNARSFNGWNGIVMTLYFQAGTGGIVPNPEYPIGTAASGQSVTDCSICHEAYHATVSCLLFSSS